MDDILNFQQNDKEVEYLAKTDERLAKLITKVGNANIIIEKDGFCCIVKYIIGQQISDKARETIWQRLCKICSCITPVKINSLNNENLQRIGLSERKIAYIRNIANALIDGEINFHQLALLSNEEIINKLISIKGIGRWTAEMYLIFSLGRLDVLSKGDGTIRRSIQWMYNLDSIPSAKELSVYFQKWKGYESIVSAYLWKSISLGLQQKPFARLLSEGGIADEFI